MLYLYPPAPWFLEGPWLFALRLIDLRVAKRLVPAGVRILQPWPGKTLGGFLMASYGGRSTLAYHELIVFPALVFHAGKIGLWISHIYADLDRSVVAGWEMWGVPKELAEFRWSQGRVEIQQAGQALMAVDFRPALFQVAVPVLTAAFGNAAQEIRWFWGYGVGLIAPVRTQVHISPGGPFEGLGLDRSVAVFAGHKVRIRLGGIRRTG